MGLDKTHTFYIHWKDEWITFEPTPMWKLKCREVFGYRKQKYIRKDMRHTTRCQNRTRFAHGWYEPFISYNRDYFD